MDTPHNDKQRKSLFPYKLAQNACRFDCRIFSYFLYSLTLNSQSLSLSDDILRERNRFEMDFHNTLWRDGFLLC